MKAIITDLDRTLLRTDKSISEYTLSALHRCRERGMIVLAASARPLRNITCFPFDAVVATCGAVIQLPDGMETCHIPRDQSEEILRRLLRYPNIFISVESSGGLFSNNDIPGWDPIVYHDFPRLPDGVKPYKILASCEDRQLYADIAQLLTPDTYHTVAGEFLIQIMHKKATKWQGVQRMLAHFGLSPADAVYFGDDNDDIEPVQNCGMGVAVANAIPAVLSVAKHMAKSNDEDGVACFIEEHIL